VGVSGDDKGCMCCDGMEAMMFFAFRFQLSMTRDGREELTWENGGVGLSDHVNSTLGLVSGGSPAISH
jgi:hypothetical protein